MVMFICPAWTSNTLFGQIWSKKSKLFKMKGGIYTNLNMLNAMVT